MTLEATPIDPREVKAGDILLMRSRGEVPKLIAWCGDSIYSHAALMVTDGEFVEGVAPKARRVELAARIADREHLCFLDAYRPHGPGGQPLPGADVARVAERAVGFLDTAFPVGWLALLGVVVAIRGKLPVHPVARYAIRLALDVAVQDAPGRMVCTELVYRSFSEADVRPNGRLAPLIVPQPRGDAPFPDIDVPALLAEIAHATGRDAAVVQAAGELTPLDMAGTESLDAPDLDERLAHARGVLGIAHDAGGRRARMPAPSAVVTANPRLVTPLDLATSPSLQRLGRVAGEVALA